MTAARRLLIGMLTTMILAVATLFHAETASAICPDLTVVNNTAVQLKLFFHDNMGNSAGVAVAPGVNNLGTWSWTPTGVTSNGGFNYAFGGNGCTVCFTMTASDPAPPQCVIVCYNPNTCTLTIGQCQAPCNP